MPRTRQNHREIPAPQHTHTLHSTWWSSRKQQQVSVRVWTEGAVTHAGNVNSSSRPQNTNVDLPRDPAVPFWVFSQSIASQDIPEIPVYPCSLLSYSVYLGIWPIVRTKLCQEEGCGWRWSCDAELGMWHRAGQLGKTNTGCFLSFMVPRFYTDT